MEDPVREIEPVIQALVSTPPSVQRRTIETYFTSDAEFIHPFCRTGSFEGSRHLIWGIYRWYKIMSPRIDLTVHSVSYDQKNETLYVSISQIFRIFFVPFYSAPVSLVTVLRLHRDTSNHKYYLKSQEDLYQTSEFIKFVLPGIGGPLIWLYQIIVSWMCLALAGIFSPISWFQESTGFGSKPPREHVKDFQEQLFGQSTSSTQPTNGVNPSTPLEHNKTKGEHGLVTTPIVEQR